MPIVPVSAAYSLGSRDFARLGQVLEVASPALVYVADAAAFAGALATLDAGEITDKGYINQRAVLDRRDDDVDRLYAPGPGPGVIEILATR